jgi:7-cyano-7-deazaguanine synthase
VESDITDSRRAFLGRVLCHFCYLKENRLTEKHNNRQAVVLLSGGLDSTTCLAIAKDMGFICHALIFRYGQRNYVELKSAKRVAETLGAKSHRVLDLDLRIIGGSALTDDLEVPKDRTEAEMESSVPITYVPARNTLFLSLALGLAEVVGACDIFIGVNALDYSGYPDCRPEFIKAFEEVARLGTCIGAEKGQKINIQTPLINLTKAQIIQKGVSLGVDYGLTHTCYDPDEEGRACGRCDSCHLRLKGFAQAGLEDPVDYVVAPKEPLK